MNQKISIDLSIKITHGILRWLITLVKAFHEMLCLCSLLFQAC